MNWSPRADPHQRVGGAAVCPAGRHGRVPRLVLGREAEAADVVPVDDLEGVDMGSGVVAGRHCGGSRRWVGALSGHDEMNRSELC